MRSLIMSIFNASTQKAVLLTCRRQQMWWRWAGGCAAPEWLDGRSAQSLCCSSHFAQLAGRPMGAAAGFYWNVCVLGRAPCLERLLPLPLLLGTQGTHRTPGTTQTQTYRLLALCLSQSCVEQILHRLGRRCTVHGLTETSWVYDSFELHSYKTDNFYMNNVKRKKCT